MLNSRNLLSLFVLVAMMCSCYRDRTPSRFQFRDTLQIADTLTAEQQDSISFLHQHHFSENFNFIVRADSLNLLKQQPEELLTGMPTDSFAVKKGKRMVVADIRILPDDAVDSVWVKLATENYEFGWIQESQMLKKVDPDDPISQFISTFSDRHLIYFLLIISLMAAAYFYRVRNNSITQDKNPEVHQKRLTDFMSVISRLQSVADRIPSTDKLALQRRISQLSMDYIYNTMVLTRSASSVEACVEQLRSEGLFPLPSIRYTRNYRLFRLLSNSRMGRLLLTHLLPNNK
jgi:penicillin-binding protein-related factor A (putative recombinase)